VCVYIYILSYVHTRILTDISEGKSKREGEVYQNTSLKQVVKRGRDDDSVRGGLLLSRNLRHECVFEMITNTDAVFKENKETTSRRFEKNHNQLY